MTDAAKILAALVHRFRNQDDEVVLTLADLNAAIVGDRTNLVLRQAEDGLHLRAVSRADALAEERAHHLRQTVRR